MDTYSAYSQSAAQEGEPKGCPSGAAISAYGPGGPSFEDIDRTLGAIAASNTAEKTTSPH
jgi:hypothetical protein